MQKEFIDQLYKMIKTADPKQRILPSLILAQGCLESRYGTSELFKEANNIFGVKGKGYKISTNECINGKWIREVAEFQKYKSLLDAVKDQIVRFTEKERYKALIGEKNYVNACYSVYAAKYATDPQYPEKLIAVIKSQKLYEYDRKENGNMIMGTPPVLVTSLDRLHPKVKAAALRFLAECSKAGIPVKITQTYRTIQTQQEYYSWGRTKINPFKRNMTKVTNCDGVLKPSRHQSGLAFDICINIKGKEYDKALLKKAGRIGIKVGLTWGGSWTSFQDMPHFEIPPSQVKNFKIKEEEEDMPRIEVSEKEKGYGIAAIKRLADLKYIGNPDVHIRNLETDPSAWAQWVVQAKIAEKMEEK